MIHGGLKILSEELLALDKGVVAQFTIHQGKVDTIRADSSGALAVSNRLKREWEQHQGTGGGEDMRRIKEDIRQLTTEALNLQGQFTFLEDALVQVSMFLKLLNDKVVLGGGTPAAPPSGGLFVSRGDFDTHMESVKVVLAVFRQEMKGAPLEF
jgi:hypothetical protein